MGTIPPRLPEPAGALAEAAVKAQSLEDVAGLLRSLRRRHARDQRDSALTYRQMAERTGWSSAAIAEYFTARTLPPTDRFDALVDVLGAAPGELRALADARDRVEENQRRTKRRRTASTSAASTSAQASTPAVGREQEPAQRTPPRQLPVDTTLFTGREQELKHLVDLAERATVGVAPGAVVISAIDGMGGIGKTALAVHAAHRLAENFPDGQLFLDLHGFTQDTAPREPGDALAGLLGALGVSPGQMPAQLDARAALYRERLAGTRTLIVLDNAIDEAQVRPLLPAASGCLVLVTSRRRLKALDDAVPVALDVLPKGQAVALLRRAARMSEESADDARWERTAELCGCLPLALVIAGALLRTGGKAWDLARLIDRLTPRQAGKELAGFTDEVRDLTAVFDLSYGCLPESEQMLYRRLGLLPGPEIDAYAAAALLDADLDQADRLVEQLADHSLLIGISPGRYRIHDLIRSHASGRTTVDPGDEREAAVDRLLGYYQHTAGRADALVSAASRSGPGDGAPRHAPDLPDAQAARAWLRTERANLDAAFDHARTHGLDGLVIALAAGLASMLTADGPWTRALEVHRTAAETAERCGLPADHANALISLSRAQGLAADYADAVATATRALGIFRTLGVRLGEANALNEIGHLLIMANDYPEAIDVHTQALEIYRALGDRLGEAEALKDLGRVWSATNNYPGAFDAYARALVIYRALGHHLGEANALHSLGRQRFRIGDYPGAFDAHTQALEIYRTHGYRLGEANTLSNLGHLWFKTGEYAQEVDAYIRALDIYRALHERVGEANTLTNLGGVQFRTGDYPGALDSYTQALTVFRALGQRVGEANLLHCLGRVRSMIGDYAGAFDVQTQAQEIYRALGDRGNESWALNHFAATVAALGERDRALELYHQALAMNRELSKPDDEAASLEGIGEHHLAVGDLTQGTEYLRQALEIFRRVGIIADAERVRARLDGLATSHTLS